MPNHDGELQADINVRSQIIRLIREWNADVVIGPSPNDYHPDHRNTAILLQDAAYMVVVPNIVSDTPALKKNPVFLYVQDSFVKPVPFHPDIAVDISDVYSQKIYSVAAHKSQFFEWLPWLDGKLQEVPKEESKQLEWLGIYLDEQINPAVRDSLIKWYGKEKANKIFKAEAFEISEYGSRPSDDEIKRLFPMLGI